MEMSNGRGFPVPFEEGCGEVNGFTGSDVFKVHGSLSRLGPETRREIGVV
jgi:hypothetical protein